MLEPQQQGEYALLCSICIILMTFNTLHAGPCAAPFGGGAVAGPLREGRGPARAAHAARRGVPGAPAAGGEPSVR